MKYMLITLLVLVFAVPVFADTGYHEVYEWGVEGQMAWLENPEQHAEFYGDKSEHNQYRWESNPAAQICQPPYLSPEPEDPHTKIVKDQAVLFPWIDFNVYEKELHWDIFKPGVYMGKSFQVFIRANTPVQVLFGCGVIQAPIAFDKENKVIIWDEWVMDDEYCLTDKLRIKSILGKDINDEGTPPDELKEWIWVDEMVICDGVTNRPEAHRISPEEMRRVPDFGDPAWKWAGDWNGDTWKIPDSVDLHKGCFYQFYEVLEVEACDSEGDYYKEIVMTVAPDP
jgi:hypothetical protein